MAVLKDARQLGCVLQDTESEEPKSFGINSVSAIHKATRHAHIRENNGPSLGKIEVKVPHQRCPYALKFEVRSQEQTERQERCARATFFSPTVVWCLPAPSVITPEEREFVEDSRASVHILSKKT